MPQVSTECGGNATPRDPGPSGRGDGVAVVGVLVKFSGMDIRHDVGEKRLHRVLLEWIAT
jgi:hypothetical protein